MAAADAIGIAASGRLLALNSYENRVYQVADEAGVLWVFKFYRPNRWSDAAILEEHRYTLELAAHELPVARPLQRDGSTLFHLAGQRYAAFEYLAGRAPELDRPDALELLGRTLARVHAVGRVARFEHRPVLSLQRLGSDAREQVLASGFVPAALQDRYADISAQLLDRVADEFDAVGPVSQLRIHGDCHPGNILWRATGPLFVDFDDCMTGPAVQDLWMFLAGGPAEQQSGWMHLMRGYESFGEVDALELRLVEPLRSLRILHYAGWLAARWDDPAFPRAFPWFSEPRYWERHLQDLMEQLSNIDEPPLLAR